MRAYRADAAGNRFVLIDGIAGQAPRDPAALARRLCTDPNGGSFRPDGLLLCLAGGDSADVRMVLYNADGSRPEACGNGLRIIALLAAQKGYGQGEFLVGTDAGVRAVRVANDAVEVCLGPVRIEAAEQTIQVGGEEICGTRVNVGNPHFVLFTEEPGATTLDELGQSLSTHESFPEGANVEFVTGAHQGALRVRIFERGVGETQACGTGAAAVAFVAVERGWAKWPVTVKLAGGELVLDQRAGGVWLGGTTQILDSFRLPC